MPIRARLRPAALLLALATAAAHAAGGAYDDMDSDSRAECLKAPGYPAKDQPPPKAAQCDAKSAYYGIGEPVDDAKARACAYAEQDYDVLSMIYANGRGVPRNIPVARKAVCDEGGSMAEVAGRLQRLEEMAAGHVSPRKPYDFCDDATSGFTGGQCTQISTELAQQKRDRAIAAMTASWTPAQQAALAALRSEMTLFVQARDGEVDLSGTARASMEFDAEDEVRRQFAELLARADAGKLAAVSPAQAKAADDRLNATWKRLRAIKDGDLGTVKQADILDTQRVWLHYRDAWVAFGKQRYPAITPATWIATLTDARVRQLKDLAGD